MKKLIISMLTAIALNTAAYAVDDVTEDDVSNRSHMSDEYTKDTSSTELKARSDKHVHSKHKGLPYSRDNADKEETAKKDKLHDHMKKHK